ncbi:MAG: hypothetical protein IIY55_07430 [Blautia sp.]|nr:hypothetical protein [Blautia sp.]
MMRKSGYSVRFLILLLLSSIFLARMVTAADNSAALQPDVTWTDEDPSSDYAEEFLQQHLEFADSDIYQEIMKRTGSEGACAAGYFDANRADETGAVWQFIDRTGSFLTGGEVNIKNGFEIAVSEIMLASALEGEYGATFAQSYLDVAEQILNSVSGILKSDALRVSFGIIPQDIQDLAFYVQTSLDALASLKKGAASSFIMKKVDDILGSISTGLENIYGSQAADFLDDLGLALDLAGAAADTVSSSYSSFIRSAALFKACLSASEAWRLTWYKIAYYAINSGTSQGTRLAKAVLNILLDLEEAEKSSEAFSVITTQIMSDTFHRTKNLGIGRVLMSSFHDLLPPGNPLRAVMDGMKAGISLSNFLTNMDSIAYYGEMAYAAGLICRYAHPVLREKESFLRTVRDYAASAEFDQTFCIYKEAQLYSFDCMIQYEQEYITAKIALPSDIILFYADFLTEADLGSTSDRIADTYIFQSYKAKWSEIRCHNFEDRYVLSLDLLEEKTEDFYSVLLNPDVTLQPDASRGETLNDALLSGFVEEERDYEAKLKDLNQEYHFSACLEYFLCDAQLSGDAFGMRFMVREYQGGPRPLHYYCVYNYDITTGKKLAWLDIIDPDQAGGSAATTKDVIKTGIRDDFLEALRNGSDSPERIPKNLYERMLILLMEGLKQELVSTNRENIVNGSEPEYYTSHALSILNNMIDGNFCFGTRGLCASYAPGAFHQPVLGSFLIEIPYSGLSGILKPQYLPEKKKENAGGSVRFLKMPEGLEAQALTEGKRTYGQPGQYLVTAEGDLYNVKIIKSDVMPASFEALSLSYVSVVYCASHLTGQDILYLQSGEEEAEPVYYVVFYSVYDENETETRFVFFIDPSGENESFVNEAPDIAFHH